MFMYMTFSCFMTKESQIGRNTRRAKTKALQEENNSADALSESNEESNKESEKEEVSLSRKTD